MSTDNRKPDFHLFVKSGDSDNAPLYKVGAAWKHGRGEGFNIVLHAQPIDGRIVAFPPKEEDPF